MPQQGFKINEKTAKTAIVGADLALIGDSEDLVSGNMANKKASFTNQLAYYQANLSFGGANIKYLDDTDSPYTITDSDGDGTFICDTSSGNLDIVIPTLAANQNRDLEFIHQTGGNTLNIDGEGAETIDGLTDIDLPKQGDRLKIKGTTSEWAITEERISCQLRLNTYAGYGSTDNQIMRFTNSVDNYGNIFIENHSTGYNSNAEGLEITINKSGQYSFAFNGSPSASTLDVGLSLNSAQLTTSITSITVTDRLGSIRSISTSNQHSQCAWSGYLEKNDVIRAHTSGVAATQSTWCLFTATYMGN